MRQKILLLGGTGAMGSHIVQLLTGTDNDVYVTSRRHRESHDNIHFIEGNAHDMAFLGGVLSNASYDAVVDFMIYDTEEFKGRSKFLLDHCKQYIFISSSRVYSNLDVKITENTPRLLDSYKDEKYLSTDEYALTKARQENILRDSGKENWTIVRPYITFSEYRLQLGVLEKENWLYRALKGRTIVFSKDIADKYTTLTYGHDVARGIISLIGKQEALGQAFHITVNESHKWQEILGWYIDEIEKKTGRRPKVYMMERSNRFHYRHTNLWQVIVDRYYDRKFDTSKINKFIDTSTFVPTEKGLRDSLSYFIHHPKFKPINWKDEAYYDKLTHEHASIVEMETIKQKIKYILYRYFIPLSKF